MRSLQIVRFQGRESDEFATVQVKASAGQIHVLTGPAQNFVAATFFESCQLYSLDDEEVSCRRKSMRISRQFETDEMFYRNDLEVIPFSTDATIEEDFLFDYQLPGFA